MLHTLRESSRWSGGGGRGLFLESALQGKEYSTKQVSPNRFILYTFHLLKWTESLQYAWRGEELDRTWNPDSVGFKERPHPQRVSVSLPLALKKHPVLSVQVSSCPFYRLIERQMGQLCPPLLPGGTSTFWRSH